MGEQRLTELIDRYGDGVVEEAIAELRSRAARQMRAKIADDPRRHLQERDLRRFRRRRRCPAAHPAEHHERAARTSLSTCRSRARPAAAR